MEDDVKFHFRKILGRLANAPTTYDAWFSFMPKIRDIKSSSAELEFEVYSEHDINNIDALSGDNADNSELGHESDSNDNTTFPESDAGQNVKNTTGSRGNGERIDVSEVDNIPTLMDFDISSPIAELQISNDIKEPLDFFRLYLTDALINSISICVDEFIIKFKGKICLMTYNPAKPTKWGIRIYALADSNTGYVYSALPYYGSIISESFIRPGLPVSSRIALDLYTKLLGNAPNAKSYHMYTDRTNFWNFNVAISGYKKPKFLNGKTNFDTQGQYVTTTLVISWSRRRQNKEIKSDVKTTNT
uniref:DDE_Tnp_1_7 domain-containing protein n=1 Tax=Glossina austeni TaxID=7395 RepID=A0A1A9V131_GLOAU